MVRHGGSHSSRSASVLPVEDPSLPAECLSHLTVPPSSSVKDTNNDNRIAASLEGWLVVVTPST